MPLESATYISDLVVTNPVHATDDVSAGDDHIRLIKSTLKNTFTALTGAVTVSHTVINGVQDASNLTSGTLPDARLSSNVPLKDAASNAFTNNVTIGGTLGVTGDVTLTAGLSVGGNLTLAGTINGVSTSDFARLSQSNVFAAENALRLAHDSAYVSFYSTANNARSGYLQMQAGGESSLWIEVNQALNIGTNNASRMVIGANGNFNFQAGTVTTSNASASEVGYKGVPKNAQSGNYTVALADANKCIVQGSTSATITIPANDVISFPIGTTLTFLNASGGDTTIAITSDTLYLAGTGFATTGSRTLANGGIATAYKFNPTEWMINGTGLS